MAVYSGTCHDHKISTFELHIPMIGHQKWDANGLGMSSSPLVQGSHDPTVGWWTPYLPSHSSILHYLSVCSLSWSAIYLVCFAKPTKWNIIQRNRTFVIISSLVFFVRFPCRFESFPISRFISMLLSFALYSSLISCSSWCFLYCLCRSVLPFTFISLFFSHCVPTKHLTLYLVSRIFSSLLSGR
jgi:hypothetical protein